MFQSNHLLFLSIGFISTALLLFSCLRPFFPKQKFFARPVITTFESRMFSRLQQAFPQHHVLAQVAFSALITSDHYKIRSKFNRKVTDFVVLDQEMNVLAIIELDDPSHVGKELEDKKRDQMLQEAGYLVLRYTQIPSVKQLQMDIR
jgi:very-short-patch-repair endonuclease